MKGIATGTEYDVRVSTRDEQETRTRTRKSSMDKEAPTQEGTRTVGGSLTSVRVT